MLPENVRLKVFVLVVLWLVILRLWLRLILVADEKLVEYFQKLLYLIHALKHLLFLTSLSSNLLASILLTVFLKQILLQLPIAIIGLRKGRIASIPIAAIRAV